MQKFLQRLFIVAMLALVIQIAYSALTFVPDESILHSITYHGKFAQWLEVSDHWRMSVTQFLLLFLLPWTGILVFNNWKTGRMFDF